MFSDQTEFSSQMQALRRHIHGILQWQYSASSSAPRGFATMNGLGMIVARGNGFDFRGCVDGIGYGAQRFSLTDVTARKLPPGKYDDGVPQRAGFEGVIISLKHTTTFGGRTIIRRDMKRLNPKQVDGMKPVGLVDLEFERMFEVYSDDQVEARTLISPDFKERLMAFNDDFLGRGVQIAFLSGEVHIALDIDENFNFNRRLMAHDYKEGSAAILTEIGSIFTLLESVQTLQSRIGRHGAAGADKMRHSYYRELMQLLIKETAKSEHDFQPVKAVQEDMRDTNFLFSDFVKGLLSPRF